MALLLYKASAGSGKTFLLTATFIRFLLQDRRSDAFARILALTFTKKATEEMKSRILSGLESLGKAEDGALMQQMVRDTGLSAQIIAQRSKTALSRILHHYGQFSVLTIDSFFQRVLHSFVLEANLAPDYGISLDTDELLLRAIDDIVQNSASNPRLKTWLQRLMKSRLENGQSIDYVPDLMKVGQQVVSESFKRLGNDLAKKLSDKDFLEEYIKSIKLIKQNFENRQTELAQKAIDICQGFELKPDDFSFKSSSFLAQLQKFCGHSLDPENRAPGSRICAAAKDSASWFSKKDSKHTLHFQLRPLLMPVLQEFVKFSDENFSKYLSATAVLSQLPKIGLVSDFIASIRSLEREEGNYDLGESLYLLNRLINEEESPFIFERCGTVFQSFLLDEFQDTSTLQWDSLRPLVINGLAQNHDSLIVGDVKQSIYRWRNSDWRILGEEIANHMQAFPIIEGSLEFNRRSRPQIVSFVNSTIPKLVDLAEEQLKDSPYAKKIQSAFEGSSQKIPDGKQDDSGYVYLKHFYPPTDDNPGPEVAEQILQGLPLLLADIQSRGYGPSDILILVRNWREGEMILKHLLQYRAEHSDDPYCYELVSQSSLSLAASPHIQLVTGILQKAAHPMDALINLKIKHFSKLLGITPPEDEFYATLRNNSLPDALERIIIELDWTECSQAVPYLQELYDKLRDLANNSNSGLYDFSAWWDEKGETLSLQNSGNPNVIRLFTIHKAKGLEAPVVIIPFCNWSLDHPSNKQPIIWAKTTPPFDSLSHIPVVYSSKLCNTLFCNDYLEEQALIMQDSINLFYVAATRARDELYLLINHKKDKKTDLADLLEETSEEDELSIGTPLHPQKTQAQESLDYSLDGIPSASYTGTLKIRTKDDFTFSDDDNQRQWGIVLHKALAKMKDLNDAPQVLARLEEAGEFAGNKETIARYRRLIEEALSLPQAAEWFDGSWKVRNENTIIVPADFYGNSKMLRPDRVMEKDGRIVVVDYKFGKLHLPSHHRQVERYARQLKAMGQNNVESYVWYVLEKVIE